MVIMITLYNSFAELYLNYILLHYLCDLSRYILRGKVSLHILFLYLCEICRNRKNNKNSECLKKCEVMKNTKEAYKPPLSVN